MSSPEDSDSLDDLLGGSKPGQPDDALRPAAFARTAAVLRRRRFARRCGWIAAFAGCYLAGVASVSLWRPNHPAELLATIEPRGKPPSTATQQATERHKSPFEQLRDAGDDALNNRADVEAAVRLYAQALRVATPEELMISAAEDSWILMALKEDHLKENPHADNHDKS